MKRTTISLPDDLAKALEREARRRHLSASEIARQALAKHLGAAGEPRELSFVRLGRSGHRNTAREMEELIARDWDGDARGR